jgi:anaphase-promoting complex subunit 4
MAQDPFERILIKRYRRLSAVEGGDISLAVNGRAGRRTVCVLDKKGSTFESLDMEADHDETMNESIEDGVNGDGMS